MIRSPRSLSPAIRNSTAAPCAQSSGKLVSPSMTSSSCGGHDSRGGFSPHATADTVAGMRYLHTMVRVSNLDESLDFYCRKLGLRELRRVDIEAGRYTLVFLGADENSEAQI